MTTKNIPRVCFTYYPRETSDPNIYAVKVFGLFYKVTANCDRAKAYNKSLIKFI